MDKVSIEGAEVVPKKFTGVSKKPIILLCVVGLVLAPIAVYDDNWLNANIDTDDFWGTIMKQNVYISLDTFQMEYCADDDCEIEEKQKLGELYQLCYDEVIEEEGDDEVDDYGKGHVAECILTIAKYQLSDAQVVDKEINVMAMMIELLGFIK